MSPSEDDAHLRLDGDYLHFLLHIDGVGVECAVTHDYLAGFAAQYRLKEPLVREAFVVAQTTIRR